MSDERKADMDAALAELEYAIWLAIRQGVIKDRFSWTQAIEVEGIADPYFVALTIGRVGEHP